MQTKQEEEALAAGGSAERPVDEMGRATDEVQEIIEEEKLEEMSEAKEGNKEEDNEEQEEVM